MATTLMPTITALICGPNRITNAPVRLPFASPVTAKRVVGAPFCSPATACAARRAAATKLARTAGCGLARHGRSRARRRIRAGDAIDGARHGADAPSARAGLQRRIRRQVGHERRTRAAPGFASSIARMRRSRSGDAAGASAGASATSTGAAFSADALGPELWGVRIVEPRIMRARIMRARDLRPGIVEPGILLGATVFLDAGQPVDDLLDGAVHRLEGVLGAPVDRALQLLERRDVAADRFGGLAHRTRRVVDQLPLDRLQLVVVLGAQRLDLLHELGDPALDGVETAELRVRGIELVGDIIIKYSGTLERYAGDGVMVVFNDPVPVENPALQAVLMALDMRDAIGILTGKWRRRGHDIGFGIGIAHGFATLGTIGFEGRFDYAAIGTVSNVASRLCDEAKTGQILISPRVLMEVEDAVAVEPVGEFELKGIRRPLAAYNVLAARSAAEPGAEPGQRSAD